MGGEQGQQRRMLNFVTFSLFLIFFSLLGIAAMIVGCAVRVDPFDGKKDYLGKNWLSLFSVFIYLMSPFPEVLALVFEGRKKFEDFYGNKLTSVYKHYGAFGFGVLFTIGAGLMFVLKRSQLIGWFCLFLNMMGIGVIAMAYFGSLAIYGYMSGGKKDDDLL